MGLDRQGLADGEDLEEERETVGVLRGNLGGEQSSVLRDDVEEGTGGGEVCGGERRMGSHP